MSERGRIDPVEIEDLKARTNLSTVFERLGVRSKGAPSARWANCCFHGEKSASLKIDDKKGRFKCFGCGASGDHFTVLSELGGKSFFEAVEILGGVRLITVEERRVIEARADEQQKEERKDKERQRSAVDRLFASGKPIAGTAVDAYLAARGLPVVSRWTFDLRFVPQLPYRGFATPDAEETVDLGAFPAMIAAIRDPHHTLIGVHRTYLDPNSTAKLTPPGDPKRNKAKKILGEQRGGLIHLSPIGKRLATGEGIETSQAWYALGHGGSDISIAASISLGNMAGSSTGSVAHPTDPKKRVPNGIPDPDRPGVILPSQVEEVILIGDGDSDPIMTRSRMLVAGRRFRAQGKRVFISMAPEGCDFADVLRSESGAS